MSASANYASPAAAARAAACAEAAAVAVAAIDAKGVSLHEHYLATARVRLQDPSPANISALQAAHSTLVLHQLEKAATAGAFEKQRALLDELHIDPESAEGQREAALEVAAQDAWLKAHSRPYSVLSQASYLFQGIVANRFHSNYKTVYNMLRLTGSVIGGSLPLQAVVNDAWRLSDIDLYIPEDRHDALPMWQGFLAASGYSVETVRVKAAPYLRAKNPRLGNSISSVITYRGDGQMRSRIIQLIHCKSIPRVLNAVDLSCTTFFHNGERMLSLDDPELANRHVAFLRYPLEELNNYEAMERILKYGKRRGFLILEKGTCEPIMSSAIWKQRVKAIEAERRATIAAAAEATHPLTEFEAAVNEITPAELAEMTAEAEQAHAAVQESIAVAHAAAAAAPPGAEFAPADVRSILTILNAPVHRN